MAAFTRSQRRFLCQGINLTHALDNLPVGKYGILQNVRSYVQNEVTARTGLTAQVGAVFDAPLHSIERFDDSTPFATNPHRYFLGGGTKLYAGTAGSGVYPQIDTGYSGNPLSFVEATPPQSPQPWLYVADTARIRKTNANLGTTYAVGILPPTAEPAGSLLALGFQIIDDFSGAFVPWVSAGASVTALGASVNRTNTTIATILYDAGVSGYCSVVPTIWDNINEGMLITFGGTETVPVTETTVAVATTTIAAILYDAGATGLCTIQPAASLGVGQLEGPPLEDYRARYLRGRTLVNEFTAESNDRVRELQTQAASQDITDGPFAEPTPSASNPRIRQVDFPVNCIVRLNAEYVRILSVAVGLDGIQSFRCVTTGAHAAGETITGFAAFRCATVGTFAAAATLQNAALYNIITPVLQPNTTYANIAGVRTGAGWAARNLAQINGRATLPDDDLHLSLRFNYPTEVQTVRVYFSTYATAGTAPSAADFINEYFFFEWRQSDIAAAIQQTNAALVSSVQEARFTVVSNQSINRDIQSPDNPLTDQPGGGLSGQTTSSVIKLGNDQWLELRCKIRDLQQIGTDPSKTLANVTAAEILVNVASPDAAGALDVQVSYDALWISGGYGPDVSAVGTPVIAAYRYRSSITGAKSNPSPPLRGGLIPRRQRTIFTGAASADPQVDLMDWFVLGGALNRWTYAGTVANGATFNNDYADTNLAGGETLTYESFPPWPTQDLPRRGTVNVSGSAVQWVSGDVFNTNWAPGSFIIINGQTYSLYAQPSSTTRLYLNENAGNGAGLVFMLPGPTLLGQIMASVWGGPINGATFLFACGDPINPGQVHWTQGNNSEEASDKNTLDLTPASDPLQAGFMWDGISFVASTQSIIRLEPTFGQASPFTPILTPAGRGFWNRWAWCVTPYGILYLAKDGIALWSGGIEVMLSDADLYPLFPHDGQAGIQVNEVKPPDLTGNILRLAYVDGWGYFDYRDGDGIGHTLAFRFADKSWWYDTYNVAVSCRESAVAAQIHQMLIGSGTGLLYLPSGTDDAGAAINCRLQWTDDQGDARRQKVYRDVMLDAQNAVPVTVALSVNNGVTALTPVLLAGATTGRVQSLVNSTLQTGIFGTNLTTLLTWSPGVVQTILYDWDLAFQPAPELATSWLSGPTTHGFRGFQEVYQILLAYLSVGTTPFTFSLIVDGTAYTYSVAGSNGIYAKVPIILQAKKGLVWQYGVQSASGVMIFDQDCEAWVSVWGQGDGYAIVRPF